MTAAAAARYRRHHRGTRHQFFWPVVLLVAAIRLPSTAPAVESESTATAVVVSAAESTSSASESTSSADESAPEHRRPSAVDTGSGNVLWDDLLGKCDGPRNTMDCVRSRLYDYVDRAFDRDFNVTDGLRFTRNGNVYESVCSPGGDRDHRGPAAAAGQFREARAQEADPPPPPPQENEPADDGWKDVTDRLYEKGAKYLVTHDFEAVVPGFLSGGPGAKVRLSPKKILPDGGIILRMDVLPAAERETARSPRFFHKMIKQLFKKKLMSSMMALMLIIKLIKIKVLFLLPLLIGAGAAKKLFLKVLLFVFPPLAHLFKLCSYYHHHAAKFHHFHHHKIKHHHHHLKIPVPVPVPAKPPPGYHSDYYSGPTLDHPPLPYEAPEVLAGDYYNRNSLETNNNAVPDSTDELASWGLGDYGDVPPALYDAPKYTHTSSPAQYEPAVKYGPGPPPSPSYVEKYVKRTDENQLGNRSPSLQLVTHDPVFTPIVHKLDEIFNELAIPDESCKEKLVCRMYGNPSKFSPHSNLVSAQLSSETAAASGGRTGVSADAARLWRYVQAAKEGQNGGDCRMLYPACGLIGL